MQHPTIRFDELRTFLLDLGFHESAKETNRFKFTHPVTDTILLFRLYAPTDIVHPRDLLVVRWQLTYNDLIEEAELERFLQKASA
jgi:hypothetical protein